MQRFKRNQDQESSSPKRTNMSFEKHVINLVLINKIFESKIVNIFLPITFNICFGCPKEPSNLASSFEYPQHMFRVEKYEKYFGVRTLRHSE